MPLEEPFEIQVYLRFIFVIDVIFKLETSDQLDAITLFQAIAGFEEHSPVMGLDGLDVVLKLVTLDDPDDASNPSQFIWV